MFLLYPINYIFIRVLMFRNSFRLLFHLSHFLNVFWQILVAIYFEEIIMNPTFAFVFSLFYNIFYRLFKNLSKGTGHFQTIWNSNLFLDLWYETCISFSHSTSKNIWMPSILIFWFGFYFSKIIENVFITNIFFEESFWWIYKNLIHSVLHEESEFHIDHSDCENWSFHNTEKTKYF